MAAAAPTTGSPKHHDPSFTMTELVDKLEGFTRQEFEDTCIRRFFFGLSNDPYGGTAGLYDMGPSMCSMKANFVDLWRRHFVIEEGMMEMDLPSVVPEEIFIASGHVAKFNDVMVRDSVTGENFRLDKLVDAWCDGKIADAKVPAA